jgi:RNA polymerase sigma factor (sigma-70 family)
MITDVIKLEIFARVSVSIDKYAYSRPSNISYPGRDDLAQEGKLAAWGVITKWDSDSSEHMRKSATARGLGAMKDALRKANMVGPTIHNGDERVPTVSFDMEIPTGCGGHAMSFHDLLESNEANPAEITIKTEETDDRIRVLKIINELGEPWRYVLLSRFYKKEKLKTVARNLGISETRVCQLEKQAIDNLKEAIEEEGMEWMR